MRLVAVSVVKNEADLIEAFVRHTQAWVDHHLVFDHDSTDGTREILQALRAEGLAVSLFRDDAPGHLQQARSNLLTRRAAEHHAADWILPLDADEFLDGPDRPRLEAELRQAGDAAPVSLPLHDYCATTADDEREPNPVRRLRHCRRSPSPTRKVLVPRRLALDPAVSAGKGSHALQRGTELLPSHPLPPGWRLAHFAQRSPQQQVLRVVRAELQRLSRGRAAAGLDLHYRLGYQLLAAEPERFFAALVADPASLSEQPLAYRGGALRHTRPGDWLRVARSLLPYLELLAASHGRLADATGFDIAPPAPPDLVIRELDRDDPAAATTAPAFAGFTALSGWGPPEGPVPEAFLPPFHWGLGPVTRLRVDAPAAGPAGLGAELLTYSENQEVRIELNGAEVRRLAFTRTNELLRVHQPLMLRAGANELAFHYREALVTNHDPRPLAAIFLRLQVTPAP